MTNDSISEDSISSPEASNADSKKKFFSERAVNHQRNASPFLYNFLTITKTNLTLVSFLSQHSILMPRTEMQNALMVQPQMTTRNEWIFCMEFDRFPI